MTQVWGQRKFATDKPWARSYDIYYGDVTLGCRMDNVTIKTTYKNVLYHFIDSLTLFALTLTDLKETMVLHVIDEFKFQQAIHEKRRVCTSITILLQLLEYKAWYLWAICDNGGWTRFMERNHWLSITFNSARTIQSMLCGVQYVTQVSLNYMLVYILKLVYIYTHLTAD